MTIRTSTYMAASVVVITFALLFMTSLVSERTEDTLKRYEHGLPIRVGYAIEPPYAMRENNGDVTGLSPDILKLVLSRLNLHNIVWVYTDFGSLMGALENQRIDIIASGMFVTEERAARVMFTDPVATVKPGLLVREGNANNIKSIVDFKNGSSLKVAVIDGSVEHQTANSIGIAGGNILLIPDLYSGVASVLGGQSDAFALSMPSLLYAQKMSEGKFEVLVDDVHSNWQEEGRPSFALRKNDELLVSRLNQELRVMVNDGTMNEVLVRYQFENDNADFSRNERHD